MAYKIVIHPKEPPVTDFIAQREDTTRKIDDYEVAAGYQKYLVYNKVNQHKHNVKVLKVSNLEYRGYCDCEDFNFKKKHEEQPCIHIYKVIHESQVDKLFDLEKYEEIEAPQVDNPGADEGAEETAEGATRIDKKGELEEWSEELGKMDIETVKRYIAPQECTDTEVKLFCNICAARGANPFLNEAYLVKYTKDEPARTIISKDFFLKKARKAVDYKGFKAGIIVKTADSNVERREGSFLGPDEELLGGWSEVLLAEKEPVKSEVNLENYKKKRKDGEPTRFWKEIPGTMIRKVSLVQALREAFPEELGGLYGQEEQREVNEP